MYVLLLALVALLAAAAAAVSQLPVHGLGERLGAADTRAGRGRQRWMQDGFVLLQVTLAVALLTGAGLTLRSVEKLFAVDVGFTPGPVLAASVAFPSAKYPPGSEAMARYLQETVRELEALPGVRRASSCILRPLDGAIAGEVSLEGEGQEPARHAGLSKRPVSPGYFATLGLDFVRGRGFTGEAGERAVVVNEAFSRELLGGGSPLGRVLRFGEEASGSPRYEIVGEVRSERDPQDEAALPAVYLAHREELWPGATFLVRAEGDPAALIEAVQNTLRERDREVAVYDVAPLRQAIAAALSRQRTAATLLSVFAGLALLLALAGVYGVFSVAVGSRQQELGVRLCLGARPQELSRSILRRGLGLSLAGGCLGILASWQLSAFLQGLLFGVGRTDAASLLGALLIALAGTLLACYPPARRARSVNPAHWLRSE